MYRVGKYLDIILKLLIGLSLDHVENRDFFRISEEHKVERRGVHHVRWCISTFKSEPVDSAIRIIKNQLEQDWKLYKRTNMAVQ